MSVECPICGIKTSEAIVNLHLDRGCPDPKKARIDSSQGSQIPSQESTADPDPKPETPRKADPKDTELASASMAKPDAAKPNKTSNAPLAERARPKTLNDYIGQSHLVGPHGVLRQLILLDRIPSMILWGPSGVGKTTFARILADVSNSRFIELSATTAGTADIKKVVEDAKNDQRLLRRKTVLFLDETHRFNRAQQDSLLPAVEKGDITLVGATTENPSFKLTGALLSRCRVFVLEKLKKDEVYTLLDRALKLEEAGVSKEVLDYVASASDGDGRAALNMLELVLSLPDHSNLEVVKPALRHAMLYDQQGDMHYDLISAFHKAVRGSDDNASLYYLARMLEAGEDPLYLSRRMVRIASEDVGLADDSCLPFAVATHTSVQQIGMPEANVMLAHCAVKLARAPKSVEVYKAYGLLASEMKYDVKVASAPVPLHLRNAPTQLMKDQGYAKEYIYPPAYKDPPPQEYLPDDLVGKSWLGKYQAE